MRGTALRCLAACAAAFILALGAPALADAMAGPSGVTLPAGNDAYAKQVARAEADDPSTDFRALRFGWRGSLAQKTSAPIFEARAELAKAFGAHDYAKVRDKARGVLSNDYTNLSAHFMLRIACEKLGDAACARHEDVVFRGLFRSIVSSGDGKSTETAWQVISIEEEYVVMGVMGLDVGMQSLVTDKAGRHFDVLEGKAKDGSTVSYFFGIDAFFGHELE